MDDAINTSAWGQVNTFMDIIGPRVNNSTKRAKPDKSQTLMRSAVKKPEPQTAAIDISSVKSSSTIEQGLKPDLVAAAALTDRSPLISRYSDNASIEEPSSLTHRVEPIEVQQYPSMDGETMQPTYEEPQMNSESTAAALELPNINIFKDPLPGTFEYSRAATTPNKSKWSLAKRISGWSVLAVAVIGVLSMGFYLNRNFSKVELYVASSRAGFAATLPSIKPTGYTLSGISTGGGVIEASFASQKSNHGYTISEKKSSVTSSSLLSNYVEGKAGLNYQTINTNGKTIYIYNGQDATWTSNGIWYVLEGNNSINNHQIINIANSM